MSESTSFGADPILVGFWALIVSPAAWISGYLLVTKPSHDAFELFATSFVLVILPIAFASRFRATFNPTEFVYRRWGRTIRVPYAEIARIEVANKTPVSGQAIGAFIVTKDGSRLPFWPKLFPQEAVKRFFALAPH